MAVKIATLAEAARKPKVGDPAHNKTMSGVATKFTRRVRRGPRGMDTRVPANPRVGNVVGANRPRGRFARAWRWAKRIFLGGALLFLLTAVVLEFGWRYGFTPLPRPVPGWRFNPVTLLAWSEIGPDSFWYWPYQLGQTRLANSAGYRRLREANEVWCTLGPDAVTNPDQIAAWLNAHQLIAGMRAVALSRTNRAVPDGSAILDAGCRLMIDLSLWQAAEAERAGRTAEAFDELLRAWRFEPFENWDFRQWQIATAWRRLALTGPALDRATAQRLMEELIGIAKSLPGPDWGVRHRIASRFGLNWPEVEAPVMPDLISVFPDFRDEFVAAWRKFLTVPESVLKVLSGGSASDLFEFRGLSRLLRPFGTVMDAAVQRATRREDLVRMRDACFGQALARLERGDTEAALAWVREFEAAVQRKPALLRFIDRPVVWNSGLSVAEIETEIRRLRSICANLEVCRLVLALRLYRDEHGAWPAWLSDLVPGYLPTQPAIPYGPPSFAYECSTNRWGLWVSGLDRRPDRWSIAESFARTREPRSRLAFVSDEFEISRRQYERERTNFAAFPRMSNQMLLRYGLIPQRLVGPAPIKPAPAATNATPAVSEKPGK